MLGEDAKRRAVVEPPMPGAAGYDTESLPRFFAEIKAVDADVTRYAIAFVKLHFAKAHCELHPAFASSSTWDAFAQYLRWSLAPVLLTEAHPAWVRELFADLCEYSRLNPAATPASRLATLLRGLKNATGYAIERSDLSYLPPLAGLAFDLVDAWEEDDLRRRNESGY